MLEVATAQLDQTADQDSYKKNANNQFLQYWEMADWVDPGSWKAEK
jgi:hypothetical protein